MSDEVNPKECPCECCLMRPLIQWLDIVSELEAYNRSKAMARIREIEGGEHRASGCRVLIVEDEYLLADDLKSALESHGAEVVGPIGDLQEAQKQIADDGFDVAVLDVNLRDSLAYGLADELMGQHVPFVFVTGYSAKFIPARFAVVHRLEKPVDPDEVAQHIVKSLYQASVERSRRIFEVPSGPSEP